MMDNNLNRRLAVWLNAYRDTKLLYDELTARTADKWLDDYPQDKDEFNAMRQNLHENLYASASYLHEIFGTIKEELFNENVDF